MVVFQVLIGIVYFYGLFQLVNLWHMGWLGGLALISGTAIFWFIIFLYWAPKLPNNKEGSNDG